jgi:hypothetical protein
MRISDDDENNKDSIVDNSTKPHAIKGNRLHKEYSESSPFLCVERILNKKDTRKRKVVLDQLDINVPKGRM